MSYFKNAQVYNIQFEMQLSLLFNLLVAYLVVRELHDHVPLVLRNLFNLPIVIDDIIGKNLFQKNTMLSVDIDFVFGHIVTQDACKAPLVIYSCFLSF